MEFKQLEAFVKVVELKSFSKAAEEIYVSQPSISAYINLLEKELQITLLNRSTRVISPTDAGKVFYDYSKNILALKNKSIVSLRNFETNTSGKIKIIASSVPAQYILPKTIADFHKRYPNIKIHMVQKDTAGVIKGILSQEAEIGFVGSKLDNEKCSFKHFMSEKLVVIAPNMDQFKYLKEFNAEELFYSNYFISREKGSGTREQYENYFREINIDIKKINECACFDNTQSIINAVSSGLGISIVSEYAAKLYIDLGLVVPLQLNLTTQTRHFHYVFKKNFIKSHLVELFIEFLADSKS